MIDQTDLAILKALSKNSRIKMNALSKKIALSEPSVKARIEKLIDLGIIQSFTIDIDYTKLGYTIPLCIQISDLKKSHHDFLKCINSIDECHSVYSVTGNENYIILGRAKSVEDIEKLLSELMAYGKVTTSVILDESNNYELIDLIELDES